MLIAFGAVHVSDGDTFTIEGEKIRILGMDTPELHPCRCAVECELGERAKAALIEALATDPLIERSARPDKYKRTLAIVRTNGGDIANAFVTAGLARPYKGERRKPWCE